MCVRNPRTKAAFKTESEPLRISARQQQAGEEGSFKRTGEGERSEFRNGRANAKSAKSQIQMVEAAQP